MSDYIGLKRKHVQNFLSSARTKSIRGVLLDEYDEPTYLGFWIKFNFNQGIVDKSGFMDENSLPAGLLAGVNDDYSAERYLKNIGYANRAQSLNAFKEILKSVSEDFPWYITSVEGLADIYKIETAQNFRGKEKKISLEFLEGIDMRITSMFDAYRKAAFDNVYMRYLLPDIMRSFSMDIYITEFRTFHTPTRTIKNKEVQTPPGVGGNQYGIDTSQGPISALANNITNAFNELDSEQAETQAEQLASWISGTGSGNGDNGIHFLKYMDEHLSVIKFELSSCEFDLESLEPSWTGALKSGEAEAATYKASIKVGKIREIAGYPILSLALNELTPKNFSDKALTETTYTDNPSRVGGVEFNIKETYNAAQGESSSPDGVYNQGPYKNGHLKPLSDIVKKSLGERLLDGLEENAFARGKNFLENKINSKFLGNVYGLSPSTILNSLSENPNALEGALRSILTKSTNSYTADLLMGNIYDNLPAPSSQNSGNPGSTDLIDGGNVINGVVESNFENTATQGNNPGNASLSSNNSTLLGNPGNVGLIDTPTSSSNLINVGLQDNGSTLEGSTGNAGLQDNGSTLEGNPGNVELNTNGSILEGSVGNAGLQDNGSTLEGNPGKVKLTGSKNTASNLGNIQLSSSNATLSGTTGNIELADNGSTLEGNPGAVELTGNESNSKGLPNNVLLKDNGSDIDGNPGNAQLSGNNSDMNGNPGSVILKDNKSTLAGSLKNVDLSGNNNNINGNLTNVELSDNGSTINGSPGNIGFTKNESKSENLGNIDLTESSKKEADLGNIGLTEPESKSQNLGNVQFEVVEKTKADLKNVGFTSTKETSKDLGNIGLTGYEVNNPNLGNINFTENIKNTDDNLGNIGYEIITQTEQTLANIGLKSAETKTKNPGNVNLNENAPINSDLGNIGYQNRVKLIKDLGNVKFNDNTPTRIALSNIGLTSNDSSSTTNNINIGLEGDENNLVPPPGTVIQNSSSDLPPKNL
jgi:hypothetical protein